MRELEFWPGLQKCCLSCCDWPKHSCLMFSFVLCADLVQDVDGGRFEEQHGQDEGQGKQGALTPAQLTQALLPYITKAHLHNSLSYCLTITWVLALHRLILDLRVSMLMLKGAGMSHPYKHYDHDCNMAHLQIWVRLMRQCKL